MNFVDISIFKPLDIWAARNVPLAAPDMILPGFRSGTVGALVAPGGAGKSYLALEIAMAVAAAGVLKSGEEIFGFSPDPGKTKRVDYLSGEDDETVLRERVYRIAGHLNARADVLKAIDDNLSIRNLVGNTPDLTDEKSLECVIKTCEGARLVIIDTLSRFHAKDENSNSDMAGVVRNLEKIAKATHASLLFLHHSGKGAATGGMGNRQQAARGASALIDNARWAAYVQPFSEVYDDEWVYSVPSVPVANLPDVVCFGVSKVNYGPREPIKFFRRDKYGVLHLEGHTRAPRRASRQVA